MTNIDSPTSATAAGPRAQLMYDAIVAGYINDISTGRRRPAPVAERGREERRRPLGRVLALEARATAAA